MLQALDEVFVSGFLAKMAEAGNARDAEQFVALCTEDVVMDDARAEEALHGRADVEELLDGIYRNLPSGFRFEVVGKQFVSFDGTQAAARWHLGVNPSSSGGPRTRRDVETVEFYRFRDGLLSHWTVVFRDRDWMGRQLP